MKFLLGLALALALTVSAQAQVTRIIAVVNTDIVTAGDIDARMNLIMRTSGIPDTPQNRQQLTRRVLQTLIDEKLEMQEAARFKISVDKQEIDKALANIEARNNMPKGGLDDYLKRLDVERSSLVDQIKASLTWNKVVQARYSSDVSVSDAEVNDEIARIKADLGKPQSHLAEIFLAVDNPTQDAEVKALADRLIAQIRAGANFGALAQQFSQSPTAATGGDLGWVTPTQFGPPLDEAIGKMNPGQISYPIRTPAGYYILLLVDRKTPGQTSVDDTQLGLVEVVFPLPPNASQQDQQHATAQAQQVSDTAKSCGEMAKIARDEAPQLSTQTPKIRAGDLPPELRATVLALKVGEASKPLPARGGIGVIMVCQRSDPPSPIPNTDQVYDQIMRQRMDQMARRYLRDLRRSAYVDVRGMNAPLALTLGEPAGIGGEITLKSWLQRGTAALPPFFVLDDPDRLSRLAAALQWQVPVAAIAAPEETATIFPRALPVLPVSLPAPIVPGKPDSANAGAVIGAIAKAVEFVERGRAAALVTNPIQKETLYAAGFSHPGHTEYLAELAGGVTPVMMLLCRELRVVPVIVHHPLEDSIKLLRTDTIVTAGRITAEALKRDFGIARPRLAVAGLNPHAGENGTLGREEIEIIAPAVAALRAAGIEATGPAPADTLFHAAARARYDAALCMYHDQALIPLKTIDFDTGVNVTLGLPFIRTSPDHGTACDIAGRGIANPASLIAAIELAGMLAKRRVGVAAA